MTNSETKMMKIFRAFWLILVLFAWIFAVLSFLHLYIFSGLMCLGLAIITTIALTHGRWD